MCVLAREEFEVGQGCDALDWWKCGKHWRQAEVKEIDHCRVKIHYKGEHVLTVLLVLIHESTASYDCVHVGFSARFDEWFRTLDRLAPLGTHSGRAEQQEQPTDITYKELVIEYPDRATGTQKYARIRVKIGASHPYVLVSTADLLWLICRLNDRTEGVIKASSMEARLQQPAWGFKFRDQGREFTATAMAGLRQLKAAVGDEDDWQIFEQGGLQ
jgi:hypothetical protein